MQRKKQALVISLGWYTVTGEFSGHISLFRALNSNVCFGRNPCQKNNVKLALVVKTSDSAIQQINYYCPEHKYIEDEGLHTVT